jgi:hypothetical protein
MPAGPTLIYTSTVAFFAALAIALLCNAACFAPTPLADEINLSVLALQTRV